MATKSKHVFSLENAKPHFESENGSIKKVTVDELPILKNLSIKRLELGPKAIREPHCKCYASHVALSVDNCKGTSTQTSWVMCWKAKSL
jgi:hypothetical protein